MKAMGLLSMLGGGGKPSDEEMQKRYQGMKESYIKRQGGMPDSPVPGASQVAYQSGSNYSIGDVAPVIRTDRKGNKFISDPHGSSDYRFNERTGAWNAGGGKTLMFTEATAPPAAPSGGQASAPVNEDWRKSIRPTVTQPNDPASTTGQMGDTYDNMIAWKPISSDGQGGVQNMNPLANPNNWVHNTPVEHQAVPNPGAYANNGIYNMLDQPVIQDKKRNPYSMIG